MTDRSPQSQTRPTDGLPMPRRFWAVLTMALAVIMAVLDGSIVNVALPAIARDLEVSAARSVWVVNAYQLAIMVSILPLASLGDIFGYRRVYRVGLAVFTVASLLCATTDSLAGLTAARVLQGLGAAGIMSVNTALVRFVFPAHRLGHGIGMMTTVVASTAAMGPTVAAAILSVADWPWLFAINVPIGAVAFLIALRVLPRTPGSPHAFDIPSAVLNVLTFGVLILAIDSLGHGVRYEIALLGLAAAGVLGYFLVRRQLTLPLPLLPVDLLRIPIFSLSVATSVGSFVAQMMTFIAVPFYLQDVLGRSQVATGLLITPWPVMVALIAPIAGRLADRHPAAVLGSGGLLILAAGLALLATLSPAPSDLAIAWRVAVCGFGFALFQAPNNRTLIGAAPRTRSGGASGMLSTARLLGQTLGAALTALVFGMLGGEGTTSALAVAAGFAVVAAAISALRLAPGARPAPGG
ncbi:MFS transporter [Arhodomonas sp. SL1]|uniref:MFS transporter n=1 Tax=Arhodomonas sp. SL1 TaxID=3425691 RepID=UPI003F884186